MLVALVLIALGALGAEAVRASCRRALMSPVTPASRTAAVGSQALAE